MKKFWLVISMVTCSIFLFISGSFIGYITPHNKQKEQKIEHHRKLSPSIKPIIGRIIHREKVNLLNKTRIPSANAIKMSRHY